MYIHFITHYDSIYFSISILNICHNIVHLLHNIWRYLNTEVTYFYRLHNCPCCLQPSAVCLICTKRRSFAIEVIDVDQCWVIYFLGPHLMIMITALNQRNLNLQLTGEITFYWTSGDECKYRYYITVKIWALVSTLTYWFSQNSILRCLYS